MDKHPTPSIYDGDWSKGVSKEFIGKAPKSVPEQIYVELTTEKVDVTGWTEINHEPERDRKDGFYRFLWENINVGGGFRKDFWRTYSYKNGHRSGWFREYYKETGLLRMKYFLVRGLTEGWYMEYYPNGQLAEKYWSKKGKIHGWDYIYYPNGQLWSKYWYRNGHRDGWQYEYFSNGVLKEKWYFSSTDRTTSKGFYFYETGELESESGDRANGTNIYYYKNGNIKSKVHYHNVDGNDVTQASDHEYFNEDGTPAETYHWEKTEDGTIIKVK